MRKSVIGIAVRLGSCGVVALSIGLAVSLLPSGSAEGAASSPATEANRFFNSVDCPTSKLCVGVGEAAPGVGFVEVSQDGGAAFKDVATPASHALNAITCVNGNQCYAVGGSTILSTTDGGARWSATSAGSALTDVSCNSVTHCVAVGWSSGESSGQAVYTTNGTKWSPAKTLPTFQNDLQSVACNGSVCVAAGETPMVTSDGGMIWSGATVAGGYEDLYDVGCLTKTEICLLVGTLSSGGKGQLVRTADNGHVFNNISDRLNSATAGISSISCGSSTSCAVVGRPNPPAALVFTSTGNGGVSWNGRTGPAGFKNPPGTSTDGALDISCATSSSCVVVGSSGAGPKVARTTNDGKSWTSGSAQ